MINYFTFILLSFYLFGLAPISIFLRLSLLLSAMMFLYFKKSPSDHTKTKGLILVIAGLIFLFGILRSTEFQNPRFFEDPRPQTITFKLERALRPKTHDDIAITQYRHQSIQIILPKNSGLRLGDQVTVSGSFSEIRSPRNPGEFNYRRYLQIKGIHGLFWVKNIDKIQPGSATIWAQFCNGVQERLVQIHRTVLGQSDTNLLIGLLVGDQIIHIPKSVYSQFQMAGLTHILVASGSQVSMVIGLMTLALYATKNRWIKLTLLSSGCLFFYIISGGGASIFRASIMGFLLVFLHLLKRPSSTLHVMAFTYLVMVMIDPFTVIDQSATLSFLATSALVYFCPPISNWLSQYLPTWLATAVSVSIGPYLITAPYLWIVFHQLSLIAVIANFALLPIIELLMMYGFITSVLGLIFPAILFVTDLPIHYLLIGIQWLVARLTNFPGTMISLADRNPIEIIALYLSIGITLVGVYQNKRTFKHSGLLLSLSLCLFWLISGMLPLPFTRITMLDVGQGDSILIETPQHKTILIDGGPVIQDFETHQVLWNAGEAVIKPALTYYGISKLDLVVATHFHMDHIGGLPAILAQFPVGTLITNDNPPKNRSNFDRSLKFPVHEIQAKPLNIQLGAESSFQILDPPHHQFDESDENNNSVVTQLKYGKVKALFMGDLENESEVIQYYGTLLRSQILKVGHHGSRTSSSENLLQAVSPKIALISVGRKNRYHHPHRSVIDRLAEHKISSYRTDHSGAVELKIYRKKIDVSVFKDNDFHLVDEVTIQ